MVLSTLSGDPSPSLVLIFHMIGNNTNKCVYRVSCSLGDRECTYKRSDIPREWFTVYFLSTLGWMGPSRVNPLRFPFPGQLWFIKHVNVRAECDAPSSCGQRVCGYVFCVSFAPAPAGTSRAAPWWRALLLVPRCCHMTCTAHPPHGAASMCT